MITNIAGADLGVTEARLGDISPSFHALAGKRYCDDVWIGTVTGSVVVDNEGSGGELIVLEKIIVRSTVSTYCRLGFTNNTGSFVNDSFGQNLYGGGSDSTIGRTKHINAYLIPGWLLSFELIADEDLFIDVGDIIIPNGWACGVRFDASGDHNTNFVWREKG